MKNLGEVRAGIIESAERHFSLLGFEKTTLDDITGDNGRSKTSVYYHFKNKHDIFKSVIDKEFVSMKEDLLKAVDGLARADAMRAYLRQRLESIQKQGAFRRFASSRFAYTDNPVSRTVSDARCQFDTWEKNFLEDNIESGQRDGSIPETISPEVFSKTLVNILKALELQLFSADDKQEVMDTYNGMIDLIIR